MTDEPYPWPDDHRGAVAITVDVDGPIPHLWKSRDASPRLAELEQRAYGPRRGIHRLLRTFERADVIGSFYIPGAYAEMHPDVVRAIRDGGHEIGLHGWMHEPPTDLDRATMASTTRRALDLLGELAGGIDRVVGYRSPSWDMTEDAFSVLTELGIRYDSSMMGDDRPYRMHGMTEVPVSWVLDDAPYYRYVGGATPGTPPRSPRDVATQWCDEIEAAEAEGTLAVVTVHDWMSGRPAPAHALQRVLNRIAESEAWLAPVAAIAAHHDQIVAGQPVANTAVQADQGAR